MNQSPEVSRIYAALSKAQAEWPDIPKTKEVEVRTERSGTYKFKYVPLDRLIHAVRPVLAKFGLGFHQGADGTSLVTTVFHESGEWFAHSMPLQDGIHIQQYGSLLTYKRRYALKAALGIESDDDDEGAGALPAEKKTIKPNSDPWSAVPKERHEPLRRIASSIIDCFVADIEGKAFEVYSEIKDNEEKLCVWALLDSKMRRRLKELERETNAISA